MQIPKNDPVRLLRQWIGGMDLTVLYRTYGRIEKHLASPQATARFRRSCSIKIRRKKLHGTAFFPAYFSRGFS